MRTWVWAGLFALLAFIVQCPATWLSLALSQLSDGALSLTNESGTLWHGSAELNWRSGTTFTAWPGRVEWRLQPGWRGLEIALHEAEPEAQVDVMAHWHWGTWAWLPGQAAFPADILEGLGSPFTTLHPAGRLEVHWGAGRWGGASGLPWALQGDWLGAATRLAPVAPLGDYRLQLTGVGKVGTLQVTTRRGVLQVEGTGSWQGGQFRFAGQARARADTRAVLAGFLSVLGQPDGDGVRLEWRR